MKHWKHLNFDQRKLIAHMLSKTYKLVEMADLLQVDASSISKEIKRNRVLDKKGLILNQVCQHTIRFPYVCNGCAKKYHACPFSRFRYDAKKAQHAADFRLVRSRSGLNTTPEAYHLLDETIKEDVAGG